MTDFQSLHCTALGYSHILKHTCCEDFSASLDEGHIHIAVVSDGHGDASCFRSHLGAKLACQTAVTQLHSFAGHIHQQHWENRLLDKEEQEPLVRQLIRSIIGNWTIAVLEQLEQTPITDEEWELAGGYRDRYARGESLKHIFGCTLIAVLVTPQYLLALQQGDGRCVLIRKDGTIEQPVPWDSRCVGNVCTSLCLDDAIESCRYFTEDLSCHEICACFAASDGIEDSMENQACVNAYFGHLAAMGEEAGTEGIAGLLENTLPDMSQYGSLDDMSIAGILSIPMESALAQYLELSYLRNISVQKREQAVNKLASMQRKYTFLKNEAAKAAGDLLTAQKAHENTATYVEVLENAQANVAVYEEKRARFLAVEKEENEKIQKLSDRLNSLEILPCKAESPVTQKTPEWEFSQEVFWDGEESAPIYKNNSEQREDTFRAGVSLKDKSAYWLKKIKDLLKPISLKGKK